MHGNIRQRMMEGARFVVCPTSKDGERARACLLGLQTLDGARRTLLDREDRCYLTASKYRQACFDGGSARQTWDRCAEVDVRLRHVRYET